MQWRQIFFLIKSQIYFGFKTGDVSLNPDNWNLSKDTTTNAQMFVLLANNSIIIEIYICETKSVGRFIMRILDNYIYFFEFLLSRRANNKLSKDNQMNTTKHPHVSTNIAIQRINLQNKFDRIFNFVLKTGWVVFRSSQINIFYQTFCFCALIKIYFHLCSVKLCDKHYHLRHLPTTLAPPRHHGCCWCCCCWCCWCCCCCPCCWCCCPCCCCCPLMLLQLYNVKWQKQCCCDSDVSMKIWFI